MGLLLWDIKKGCKKRKFMLMTFTSFFAYPLLGALVAPQRCHIPQATKNIIHNTKIIAIYKSVTFSLIIYQH